MAEIKVNLNRITRAQFFDFIARLQNTKDTNGAANATGELVELVIEDWPYEQPITPEGYNALGMLDAIEVDNALTDAMGELASKNLARRSISPVSSGRT